VLRSTQLPPIPSDEVWFEVQVDFKRCSSPALVKTNLNNLQQNGLTQSIAKLIICTSSFYLGYNSNLRGRLNDVWTYLSKLNPRPTQYKGRNRLLFSKVCAQRPMAHVSEILGAGAGLLIARHIYNRPLRAWQPKSGNNPLDYYSLSANGSCRIEIEVRGRFDRNNWTKARDQIVKKIPAQTSKSGSSAISYAGIIFAPRTTKNPRKPDFLVVDPEIPGHPSENSLLPLRLILRKYAPYFVWQGFTKFAQRLIEISKLQDNEFANFLEHGDDQLRRFNSFRTSMHINGIRYFGTVWDGILWPEFLTGVEISKGAFIDGLAEPIIDAMRTGKIKEILFLNIEEHVGREDGYVRVLLDDGRARAWAPSIDKLLKHP